MRPRYTPDQLRQIAASGSEKIREWEKRPMIDENTEKWDALVPTLYLLLSNGWGIEDLWKDGRAWDSYVVQAERGDWLLEIMTCFGLTDDCVLARPESKQFIRLTDVNELRMIAQMNASEIGDLWRKREEYHLDGEERAPVGDEAT